MWVIGDIHGCYEELNELINLLPKGDKLFFVGDYVDRGPNSKKVIDKLLEEKKRSVFIRGNHEDMMINALSASYVPYTSLYNDDRSLFFNNGGNKTADSYGQTNIQFAARHVPKEHWDFFKSLKYFHEEDDFVVVHAGFKIGIPLQEQDRRIMMWIRDAWYSNESQWKGKFVIHGHTPTWYINGGFEPIVGVNSINIDTFCYGGGRLTAYNPITKEIVYVDAKKVYVAGPWSK